MEQIMASLIHLISPEAFEASGAIDANDEHDLLRRYRLAGELGRALDAAAFSLIAEHTNTELTQALRAVFVGVHQLAIVLGPICRTLLQPSWLEALETPVRCGRGREALIAELGDVADQLAEDCGALEQESERDDVLRWLRSSWRRLALVHVLAVGLSRCVRDDAQDV
ncbi:MAG: hypothetical protein ACJA1R_001914 [Flavobacteriales bacterium]